MLLKRGWVPVSQEAEAKLAAVRQRAEVEKREAAALLARSDAEKRRVQEKYQKARSTLREITAEFQNVRDGQSGPQDRSDHSVAPDRHYRIGVRGTRPELGGCCCRH